MTQDHGVALSLKADIKADVNKTLDPLVKSTGKGISRLFSLPFARREAENMRYAALIEAQTQRDRELILLGEASFIDGKIVESSTSSLSVESIIQAEDREELENYVGNILMAAEALENVPDEEISVEEIGQDFFARWRREAKVIGDKELQRLWGRLLAEEIKEPGGVSFRVLDVLKNVSSSEARLFQRIAPYVCDSDFIVSEFADNNLPNGFSFNDYLSLLECGLTLNAGDSVYWFSTDTMTISGKKYTEVCFKNLVFAIDIAKLEVTVPGAALSSAGKVALKICDYGTPNIEVVKYFCNVINNQPSNPINRVFCYSRNATSIYDNEIPIFDSRLSST